MLYLGASVLKAGHSKPVEYNDNRLYEVTVKRPSQADRVFTGHFSVAAPSFGSLVGRHQRPGHRPRRDFLKKVFSKSLKPPEGMWDPDRPGQRPERASEGICQEF